MEAQAIFRWWYVGGEKLVLYTKEIKVMICYTKGERKNVVHSIKRRGGQKYMAKTQQLTLKAFATSS